MSSRQLRGKRETGSPPARVFVDSGAWLAFFSANDGHHAVANALLQRAAADTVPLLTTNLVLAEVHRLLLFRAGPRAAASALRSIDASALCAVIFATERDHKAARAWLAKLGDQEISYTDAVSFSVMEAERCKVAISFDHDFWLAGFELWQV